MTLEHRHPFSLGGPATVENLCLLCKAHNEHSARRVFGEVFIASRRAAREGRVTPSEVVAHSQIPVRRPWEVLEGGQSTTHSDAFAKVRSALTHMGFYPRTVASTLKCLHREHPMLEVEPLLRAALTLLTPLPS